MKFGVTKTCDLEVNLFPDYKVNKCDCNCMSNLQELQLKRSFELFIFFCIVILFTKVDVLSLTFTYIEGSVRVVKISSFFAAIFLRRFCRMSVFRLILGSGRGQTKRGQIFHSRRNSRTFRRDVEIVRAEIFRAFEGTCLFWSVVINTHCNYNSNF